MRIEGAEISVVVSLAIVKLSQFNIFVFDEKKVFQIRKFPFLVNVEVF
jgi:hypothetical protein